LALGLAIVASGGLEEKVDKALRSYSGPGDAGNTDYHGGHKTYRQYFDSADVDGD